MRLSLLALAALALALLASALRADDKPLRDVIDAEIGAAWQREKLTPAAPATDAEFLRRAYLDLVGAIPTHEEAAAFLDDASEGKRAKLIDKLLDDPRFARHQADVWDLILFTRNPPGYDTDKRAGIQKWLEKQFAENVPYDKWVRTLLEAKGNSADDGPPLYLVQYRGHPEDATEAVTQTFLGVQLQCARCHDHPYEDWTQRDFYGMAGFLSRLQVVQVGKSGDLAKFMVGEKSTGDILFTGSVKDQEVGKKGEPVKPKFLAGDPLDEPEMPKDYKEPKFEDNKTPPEPKFSRKDQLAAWVTKDDNRYFAKAIANRVWAQYMGKGLVHPVDNMSESNMPTHPALLAALAADLKQHAFDLKGYIRELMNSKTYQLSSRGGTGDPLPVWHEVARMRPLSAEELADGWREATWANRVEKKDKEKSDRYSTLGRDYMIRYFGTPNTGAGDFQGGLSEHLFLNNGNVSGLIGGSKGSLVEWLGSSKDPIEAKIERLYLSTLTRRPAAEEIEKVKAFVDAGEGKQGRWQDVVWALVTSSEFRFNH